MLKTKSLISSIALFLIRFSFFEIIRQTVYQQLQRPQLQTKFTLCVTKRLYTYKDGFVEPVFYSSAPAGSM